MSFQVLARMPAEWDTDVRTHACMHACINVAGSWEHLVKLSLEVRCWQRCSNLWARFPLLHASLWAHLARLPDQGAPLRVAQDDPRNAQVHQNLRTAVICKLLLEKNQPDCNAVDCQHSWGILGPITARHRFGVDPPHLSSPV